MRPSRKRTERADSGFTMFEALVAIALMGLIMGALATVTAQWLPNWTRGLVQTQRNEQVAIALDRLVADLAAAEHIMPHRSKGAFLFGGVESGVTFVRSALGPNSRPGLEIVQIAETNDIGGPALVRMRAPFTLLPTGDLALDPIPFADPVVLLRAPYRVVFAYADALGQWKSSWRSSGQLPSAVRFDVRDAERRLLFSTATRIHVDTPAPRPDPVEEALPGGTQAASNNPSGAR